MTQLSTRSHPRHLMGKRTAQKDAIKDITSDSQVNSYFPHRWTSASLTFNIYFYLFLDFYIIGITINNGTPHLKSPKNQNRRVALGRPEIKFMGGGGGEGLYLYHTFKRFYFYHTVILIFHRSLHNLDGCSACMEASSSSMCRQGQRFKSMKRL